MAELDQQQVVSKANVFLLDAAGVEVSMHR